MAHVQPTNKLATTQYVAAYFTWFYGLSEAERSQLALLTDVEFGDAHGAHFLFYYKLRQLQELASAFYKTKSTAIQPMNEAIVETQNESGFVARSHITQKLAPAAFGKLREALEMFEDQAYLERGINRFFGISEEPVECIEEYPPFPYTGE